MVERADAGDPAARDALFASLYSELHTLAQFHLQRSGGQLTMGATTLLHEAYLDLNRRSRVAFPDRLRFLKYASRAMRGLVIDYIRARRAQKRGGEITFVSVSDENVGTAAVAASVEAARSCARRAGAARSVTRRAGRSEVLLRLVVRRNRGHARRLAAHGRARLGQGPRAAARHARKPAAVGIRRLIPIKMQDVAPR